ncbi:Stress responsive alpha-beta barrel domain-containing protein [[Leptolyngbya] sp. PCC 7376]|uniref:Dabb family protein n=1 Tax=[Leptolyngbya] sp. PCC 7376 TaxID=111781 RepID=UPI00029F382C|nr:Dabb family protein [[Leptolyngbya] sp. PCC 7376]AFY40473.1 Stress responsive alpha-beta barrel domain-containing protein [[Leptolyngbya] sp. PCC 7376]
MSQPLHHIVLFELSMTTTTVDTQAIIDDGIELLGQIPGVLSVDLGLKAREDREVHIKSYQLGLYVKLQSDADLDVYSPHPNHQEFLARHKTKWTKVQVVDFAGK